MNFIVAVILMILSWQDIQKKKINLGFCIISICFIISGNLLFHLESLLFMISGLLVGGFVMLVSFISREAIGMGDGVAFIITGLATGGMINFEILIISLFLASFAGMYQLILKKCNSKETMAFLPYITISYILRSFII
ncbi:MAG: hypothetical protein HFI34_07115 [Lachnospiraceae bacterium]|nr:hypothetical protein [Lachnospiraceae bacterium]